MCDTTSEAVVESPSMASNDPVISRIKRDVERKQEFLRATHLPNYLASPTNSQASTVIQQQQQQSSEQQCQPHHPPPPHPVYFGDRFPVHQPRSEEEEAALLASASVGGHNRQVGVGQGGAVGQFQLYGLPIGKTFCENALRKKGHSLEVDEKSLQISCK